MVKILTVANKPKYYYPYLVDTVKKNNGELITLGTNEEWQGYKWKFEKIVSYLKTVNNDNEIICVVDGYDVICIRDLTNLKKDFLEIKKKTKSKLVVSSVVLPNFIERIRISTVFDTCKNQDLNTGCYIGYSQDILDIFTKILQTKTITTDDQTLLIAYCNLYPDDIYIDTQNDLFISIQSQNNEIEHLLQNNHSNPYFLHGPGSTSLDNVLNNYLGYSNVDIKSEFKKDNTNLKKIPYYTKEIILKNYLFILLFILFALVIIYFVVKNKNYITRRLFVFGNTKK